MLRLCACCFVFALFSWARARSRSNSRRAVRALGRTDKHRERFVRALQHLRLFGETAESARAILASYVRSMLQVGPLGLSGEHSAIRAL